MIRKFQFGAQLSSIEFLEHTSSKKQHYYLENDQIFSLTKVLKTANYKKHYFQQDPAARAIQTWLEGKFNENYIRICGLHYPPILIPLNLFMSSLKVDDLQIFC